MYHAGLDAHKQYTTIAVLDGETGEMVVHKRVSNTAEAFAEALAGCDRPVRGLVEAGRSTWALYDRVHHLFDPLLVGDAKDLHDRRPSRAPTTDVRVAQDLAFMAASEYPPAALWVPDLETRVNRAVTRGTEQIAHLTTTVINSLRSLCASFGLECPVSSLHIPRGKQWLAQVELPEDAQAMFEAYVAILTELEAQRAKIDKIIEKRAKADPDVRHLMTIAGVGPLIGLGLKAEIGDPNRFRHGKALAGYAGLAPQVHQSGDKTRYGSLPPASNKHLRYFAVQAAQHIANTTRDPNSPLRRYYFRIAFRRGSSNVAKVALARKLLALAHHLLTHDEDYVQPPPETG